MLQHKDKPSNLHINVLDMVDVTDQKQTPWVKGKWRYTISGRIFPYYLHPMMRTMNEGKGTTGEYIVPERKIYKYDISDKL